MRKTKEAKVDHCAVDPNFEAMIWDYVGCSESGAPSVGELVLWRKVITKALLDLCSIATTPAATVHRAAAERWFLESQNYFVVVCELAEADAEKLRKLVRLAVANPETVMLELRERLSRV